MKTCCLVVLCAVLSACSSAVIVSKPATVGGSGIAYALPKAQAEVQVQRARVEQGDIDKASKRVAELKVAKAAADADKQAADKEAARAKADAAKAPPGPVKDRLTQAQLEAEARAKARTAEAEKLVEQLASAEAWVEQLKAQPNACVLTASVKLLDPVPDRRQRYLAQHQSGQIRDDHYILKVSNGMLGSASSDATGQLGSALQSLAGFAGTFSTLAETRAKSESSACKPGYVQQVFDPSVDADWMDARKHLAEFDPTLRLIVRVAGEPQAVERSDLSALSKGGGSGLAELKDEVPGLVYRAPIGVSIVVAIDGSPKPTLVQVQGLVPDASTVAVLPVMGDMLTRRYTGYEFVNGMPVSMDETRPSKLAAALRIPIDMAKAFVEVPASIFKLRVDLATQQNNLSEQEIVALKKQLALLEAEQALRAQQKKPPPGDTP